MISTPKLSLMMSSLGSLTLPLVNGRMVCKILVLRPSSHTQHQTFLCCEVLNTFVCFGTNMFCTGFEVVSGFNYWFNSCSGKVGVFQINKFEGMFWFLSLYFLTLFLSPYTSLLCPSSVFPLSSLLIVFHFCYDRMNLSYFQPLLV